MGNSLINRLQAALASSSVMAGYEGDADSIEREVRAALESAAADRDFSAKTPVGASEAIGVEPGPHGFMRLLESRLNLPERSLADWEESFDLVPTLRAVVTRKADRVARKKWHLHKPARHLRPHQRMGLAAEVRALNEPEARFSALDDLTGAGDLVEIHDHPLLRLIHGGNGYLTGFWVRWLLSAYLDLTGEVPVLLDVRRVRSFDIPVMAFPVPPSWCKERPTPQKPRYIFHFNGYRLEIPARDVLWIRVPSPANPYGRSRGLAMTLADELDADENAARFIAAHFYRRGRPDVLITGPGLSREGTATLEKKWARAGRKGPGAPFFLSTPQEKPSVHHLGHNMEQMQMPSLRRMGRDHVLQTFGMPPELMGVLDNGSNRSTVDAAGAIFDEWAILPRLLQLQEEFEQQLIPRYPRSAALGILSFDNPVSADREFQLKTFRAQPSAPTQAEWRRLQTLPKRRGTNVHMVKGVPAERLDRHQPPSAIQAGKTTQKFEAA